MEEWEQEDGRGRGGGVETHSLTTSRFLRTEVRTVTTPRNVRTKGTVPSNQRAQSGWGEVRDVRFS